MSSQNQTYEWPIPIENGQQVGMIVSSSLCIAIPLILVILRLIARHRFSRAKLDASDYFAVASYVFVLGICIDSILMVLIGGFSFDIAVVQERFGPDTLTTFFKCMTAFPLLWNCGALASKLSVLAMYKTLMPIRKVVLPVYLVGGFVCIYNVSGVIAVLCMCQPFRKMYDWQGLVPGKCGNVKVYYEWMSGINLVSDFLILILPMPSLWGLQLQLRKKIVLCILLGIGCITCAVTIYRQSMLPNLDVTNQTGSGVLVYLLTAVEIAVATALACVPFLRPLFRGMFGSTNDDAKYSVNPSNYASGYVFSSKGTKQWSQGGFDELKDDGSEIQLQNVDPAAREAKVRVETTWEVESRHEYSESPTRPGFRASAACPKQRQHEN